MEVALADLFAAALRLPLTDVTNSEPPDRSARQPDLMARLAEKVGKDYGFYRFVFNPFRADDEPVGGTIAEDLVSVYEDLQVGSDLLAASAPLQDVVWEWQLQFRTHWGRHAGSRVICHPCFRPDRATADAEHLQTLKGGSRTVNTAPRLLPL